MPTDVSLSDSKCWNGGQKWVKDVLRDIWIKSTLNTFWIYLDSFKQSDYTHRINIMLKCGKKNSNSKGVGQQMELKMNNFRNSISNYFVENNEDVDTEVIKK